MNLGFNIMVARRRKGLGQKELAEKAGITSQTVSDIERGKIGTSIKTLQRIAKALDTTFTIGGEEE